MEKRYFSSRVGRMSALLFLAMATMLSAVMYAAPQKKVPSSGKVKTEKRGKTKMTKQQNTFETPDFAFPQTVSDNAEHKLSQALEKGESVEALRAAMQMTIARDLVSNDNYKKGIELFDSLSKKLPAPYSQLAALLEARLYADIYNSSRWTYNNRTLPLSPVPANVTAWSRDIFSAKIRGLVADMFSDVNAAKETGIEKVARIVDNTSIWEKRGMTVYDFMTMQAVELLSDFSGDGGATIPFGYGPAAGNRVTERNASSLMRTLIDEDTAWNESRGNGQMASAMSYFYFWRMPWEKRSDYAAECIKRYIDTPWCGPFLLAYNGNEEETESDDDSENENAVLIKANRKLKERYSTIKSYLDRFPDCPEAKQLRVVLSGMECQAISTSVKERPYPGEKSKVEVNADNIFGFNLLVVKLPDSYAGNSVKLESIRKTGKVVDAVEVKFTGTVPEKVAGTEELPGLASGVYVLLPSRDRTMAGVLAGEDPDRRFAAFTVSRLAIFRESAAGGRTRLYVADGRNLQPVEGASVTFTERRKEVKTKKITNSEGYVDVPAGSYDIYISKGHDFLKENIWSYNYGNGIASLQTRSRVLTDLSIYRPGDTVQFLGVVYSQKDRDLDMRPRVKVSAILRDANYQKVDSLDLITDEFGRVTGKLKIPDTGLLGTFRLILADGNDRNNEYGSTSVEVAEYKAPTFHVTTEGAEGNYKIGDMVKIKGKAMTYSGMPVAGATVKYDIRFITLPWLDAGENASYGGEASTDGNGSFTIELPTEGLRNTPYAFGGYILNVSVTNQAGETQQAPASSFSLGTAYTLQADLPDKIDASKGEQTYAVRVFDITDKPVKRTVYYKITTFEDGKNVIASGEFESPVFKFNAASIPSGKYMIEFSLDKDGKSTAGEPNENSVAVIYRENETTVPYKTPLWIPESRIVADRDAKSVKIKVGSAFADSYIFMQTADCDKVLEERWLKVDAGTTEVEVPVPAADNRLTVRFAAMRYFDKESGNVSVIPAVQLEQLNIKAESFRDRIVPGARESWKFNFSMAGKPMSFIPVAAVMTDKALNDIAPFAWRFNPASDIPYGSEGGIQWFYGNTASWSVQLGRISSYGAAGVAYPLWNMYGYSFYGGGRMYKNMIRIRGAAPSPGLMMADSVNNEMKEEADMVLEESVTSSANMDMSTATGAEAPAEDDGAKEQEKTELRQISCPLAFFMPSLETDADGNATVEFAVPDFNGTWQLQIAGYAPDMKGAVSILDAVASKPVMASMNAPRFVRTGDTASIAAMLYNNSTEEIPVHGKIEVVDPATGKVIKSFTSTDKMMQPAESQRIALEFGIPSDLNAITVRVYAYGGGFSDGEQTVLPVFPSSEPVTEGESFYIAPGQHEFTKEISGVKENGKLTLQYCDNPIWEVVTALPDISEPKSNNALSLVYSLYGNAIGAGLAKDFPEISEAIKIFSDPANSADSTLVSNLEKNAGLKNVLLNNTPWVRSAASETMRMQDLVKYGDADRSRRIVDTNLERLAALQNPDGGWSWCDGMESSEFITGRVLLHLGMLKDMGYLPEEGIRMAEKAVRYADGCFVKSLEHYRRGEYPYISLLNYLYVRSNFANVKPNAAFASMKAKGIAAVKAGWKDMGIYEKATAATLLSREKYPMEARVILESLRQYASVDPAKGMWFDNLSSSFFGWNKLITTAQVLEAYSEIEPQNAAVDQLRQWLLMMKQVENWGADRETAEVIHSILSSGTKWTVPSAPARIYVGGKLLDTGRVAALTGSLTASVDVTGKESLRIERSGNGPAWGGLIRQYIAPAADVKAAGDAQLSIEKKLYSIEEGSDGSTAKAGTLKTGDKVRVTLTLKCDRDLEYVAVMDARAACMEPAEQLSGYSVSDGVWMYKEVRDNSTNLFIPFLGKGTHVISYDCYIDREGEYTLGVASAQSQYAPAIAAHSAGEMITVE